MDKSISFFMQDDSNGSYGSEAILDYQMSWLIRLATKEDESNGKLRDKSFYVLRKLLEIDNTTFEVVSVKVWKQWKYIDVLAEVSIKKDNVTENHLIVIENKIYQKLSEGQLNKNSQVIINNYNCSEYKIHYWLIYGDENAEDTIKQACTAADPQWKPLWFYDVVGGEPVEPTGNDLFDEFWVKKWY